MKECYQKGCCNPRAKYGSYCDLHKTYRHYEYKFNLTMEEVDELLSIKDCEICGTELIRGCKKHPDRACVDHDHTTKEIRGVLCNSCNLLLGYAKDDIKRLYRAINYLTR